MDCRINLNLLGWAVKLVRCSLIGPAFSANVHAGSRSWRGVTRVRGVVGGQVIFDECDSITCSGSGRFEYGIDIWLLGVVELDRCRIWSSLLPTIGRFDLEAIRDARGIAEREAVVGRHRRRGSHCWRWRDR